MDKLCLMSKESITAVSVPFKKQYRWLLFVIVAFALVGINHYYIVPMFDYANKDFMTLWAGGRALLDGVDQYHPEGWVPLFPKYNSVWIPNQTNPYPIWASLLLVPFAVFSVEWGAALWLTLCELLLMLVLWQLVTNVYDHRPISKEIFWLYLVGFTSITNVLIMINGQFTYILLAVLSLFLLLYLRDCRFIAGFTLALLLLKPNPFLLLLPLVGLGLIVRREWRMIAGGLSGGMALFFLGWLIQPGWLAQWFAIRSKTAVVTITPTLWGLAAEITPNYWLPVGLVLVGLFTIALGWFIFTRPALPMAVIVSLAIAGSLLITPYGWAYEHALLFIPWVWLFATVQPRQRALWIWIGLAWILPWVMFGVAVVRINDSFGFIVPLVTLIFTLWWSQKRPLPNQPV